MECAVADTAPTPYVAREADLDTLKAAWATVLGGKSQTVHLSAPLGGGKRAIVGELCRSAIADAEDDVLLWRVNVREEDEGMAVVLRAYAALFQAVNRSQSFRGSSDYGSPPGTGRRRLGGPRPCPHLPREHSHARGVHHPRHRRWRSGRARRRWPAYRRREGRSSERSGSCRRARWPMQP